MRRLLLIGLIALAGCQNTGGGVGYHKPDRADDPMFNIPEQERRGRERYSYVEDNSGLSPKTYVDRPSTTGR